MSEYQTPIPENPKPEHSGDCNVSDGCSETLPQRKRLNPRKMIPLLTLLQKAQCRLPVRYCDELYGVSGEEVF